MTKNSIALPEHSSNMSELTAIMEAYPPEKLEALTAEEQAQVISDMETAAYADMDRRAQLGELATAGAMDPEYALAA